MVSPQIEIDDADADAFLYSTALHCSAVRITDTPRMPNFAIKLIHGRHQICVRCAH